MTATMTIFDQRTGESRTLPTAQAENLVRNSWGTWSDVAPLPAGWDREPARYRVEADLHPSPLTRHRFDPPFVSSTDSTMFQYTDRVLHAGEVVELLTWPHPSMTPLNEVAKRVMAYFTSHSKSRLPKSPFHNGQLRLDDGLSGTVPQERLLGRRPEPAVPSPIRAIGR
ncbi:hypothetical protein [Bradyrhizobium sp. RT10b]|uniref:hypothetical protein n=1 Tax=Bradyrhizobium sp. RT10b TaxID=3156331 RepID=UPI00339B9218